MDTEESKLYVIVLGGISMLIALIAVLILNILRHQRLLNARYLQYAEVVIIALDQERNRMASDLHDSIGASLTVIKHQLEAFRPDAPEHHSFIGEMIHSVMEVIKQVRAVSLNMMPEVLLKFGLHTALMDMVRQKSFAAKIEISLDYSIGEVSSEAAVHIYHIVQEILNNALKHSKAELILVALKTARQKIELNIKDNGIGFNKNILSGKPGGLGFHTIFTRISMLKGKGFLVTKPNKGVEYRIEFPEEILKKNVSAGMPEY